MTKGCLWQPITELHSSTRSGNLLLLSCCPGSAERWAFLALVWPVVHNVSKATICCIAPFAASLWSAIPIPCETQPSCPIQALSYSTKVFSCILSLTGTMRRKPVSWWKELGVSSSTVQSFGILTTWGGKNEKVKWFNWIIWRTTYAQLCDITELKHSLDLTHSYLFMFFTLWEISLALSHFQQFTFWFCNYSHWEV